MTTQISTTLSPDELNQMTPSSPAPAPKPSTSSKDTGKGIFAKNQAKAKALSQHTANKAQAKKGKPVAKATPKKIIKPSSKPAPKKGEPSKSSKTASGHCSVCGKPLTRGESIEAGVGDYCAHMSKLLPKGTTLEQHYENVTLDKLPDGFIKFQEAKRKAMAKGTSGYRFMQACGGNRALRKPLFPEFKMVFYKGARYVSSKCLSRLKDLEKK